MFRAFLHLSQQEVDELCMQEFLDYAIVLEEALKLFHAPFMPHDQ